MSPEAALLISGLVFGLSGGLTPGPLLALIISQSLRYGTREGIRIAIAPLLTDLPIILIALFAISRLSERDTLLGVVSLLGALYLVYLAWESLTFKGANLSGVAANPNSIRKGVIANLLNPSPYIFWFTIGAPTVIKGWGDGRLSVVLFIAGLYVTLVGSKVLLAIGVGRSRGLLKSKYYVYTIRALGLCLFGYAVRFGIQAYHAFGIQ